MREYNAKRDIKIRLLVKGKKIKLNFITVVPAPCVIVF